MNIRIYLTTVLLLAMHFASGQGVTDSLLYLPDSVRPLTIDNFYAQVLKNHPVAKQADLLTEFAKQELRLARGNFDPKLEAQYLAKNFGDVDYYKIFNSSLKFPSVLPFDPSIGVEQNSGKYLNPERYISENFDFRQFYAGVSLPLLRGLITDDRRAALRQAELFGDMMEAEQLKAINKLFLEAAKDYWQWSISYYNFRLYNQNVAIAEEIFRRVRLNYELGEAAPIDTIQAKITLQQRLVERQEALLDFQNSGIQLSNYLWDSLSNPLELSLQFAPVMNRDIIGITAAQLEELTNLARENHPDIQKLDVKLQQLDVDRRLAAEYLKPKLDLNYYFLNQPFDPEWNSSFGFGDNYKFGVDFSFPIFLRKERAKLAQTRLKITNTMLDRSITERQVLNQINTSYNTLVNNGLIISQQSEMVNNYNRLLEAELINLENGESDLFKINIQIEKLIQSQSKFIKLLGDYEKQKAFLYWAAGVRRLN
ncbi:TolC family protein [Chryseolinea sp. H1M3-3]|uniref:TolC family protein n=1 Tax=Chryseolinea sp. H1M3-3 TaxID=3034144 RepID=UPI0023EAED5D|nr:TolC family protein [Chryseolinea sp. H1M3-3]